jgi:hypothetical protein
MCGLPLVWPAVTGASSPPAKGLIFVKRIKFMTVREVNENGLPKKPLRSVMVLAEQIRIEV